MAGGRWKMPTEAPAVLPAPVLGSPPVPRVPQPLRFRLANGLRVVAAPEPGLPRGGRPLALPAGAAADPPPRRGTASLKGHLLTEGTLLRSADELQARL